MKKLSFIALSIFFMAFIMSCNRENEQEQSFQIKEMENTEYIQVISELQKINDSILSSCSPTRGAGRWAVIASSDIMSVLPAWKVCTRIAALGVALSGGTATPAVGTAVLAGTAFLAGSASYGAYLQIKGCELTAYPTIFLQGAYRSITNAREIDACQSRLKNWVTVYSVDNMKIQKDSAYADIANLHNVVLNTAMNYYDGNSFQDADDLMPILMKAPIIEEDDDLDPLYPIIPCNNYGFELYSSDNIENMVNTTSNECFDYINDKDYVKLFEKLKNSGYITVNVQGILKQFFDAFCSENMNVNSVDSLVDSYIQVVKNMNTLSNEERTVLMICFETARSSTNYWAQVNLGS